MVRHNREKFSSRFLEMMDVIILDIITVMSSLSIISSRAKLVRQSSTALCLQIVVCVSVSDRTVTGLVCYRSHTKDPLAIRNRKKLATDRVK